MMMNLHLVALVVMLISLGGSDCAQGCDGCGDGENDFLHYKTLKSVLWSNQCSTTHAASARKHAISGLQTFERRVNTCADATRDVS